LIEHQQIGTENEQRPERERAAQNVQRTDVYIAAVPLTINVLITSALLRLLK